MRTGGVDKKEPRKKKRISLLQWLFSPCRCVYVIPFISLRDTNRIEVKKKKKKDGREGGVLCPWQMPTSCCHGTLHDCQSTALFENAKSLNPRPAMNQIQDMDTELPAIQTYPPRFTSTISKFNEIPYFEIERYEH